MDEHTDYERLMTRSPRVPSKASPPWAPPRPLTRPAALREVGREVGSVLYAVRLADGLIKIGYTTNMSVRFRRFSGYTVLAFTAAQAKDEQPVHDRLCAHVAHGLEYYHPTPEVLSIVNEWRVALGLDLLDK